MICSFCFVVLFGRLFQLSKVDFGSTNIGWESWRLSGGLNDRWRWTEEVDWVFQVWMVDLASTWIGWENFWKRSLMEIFRKKKSFTGIVWWSLGNNCSDWNVFNFDRASTWMGRCIIWKEQ